LNPCKFADHLPRNLVEHGMNSVERHPDKELYRQLRALPWEQLWRGEAARFNQASPQERSKRVAVIRAVGVVFGESGAVAEKEEVRRWLLALLQDPCEKARRYAMAALPKIGAGPAEEAALISVLRATSSAREKKFLGQTLEKIGGTAALEIMGQGNAGFLQSGSGVSPLRQDNEQSRDGSATLGIMGQKILARFARGQKPSAIRPESILSNFAGVRLHLRGRRGLEGMVREEVEASARRGGKFRVMESGRGLVGITPVAPFSLADIYAFRCFGSAGFVLGTVPHSTEPERLQALAAVIASDFTRRILRTFTEGTARYRLNFVSRGHQRSAVRMLAARVYDLCPELLNDGSEVTWTVDIHPAGRGPCVELRPNMTPDPRFYYRKDDVPAASHPPLAACMARLAGRVEHEIVWDPFCGSGLELIESALLGGLQSIYGTDLSADALAIARANFAAAKIEPVPLNFFCRDFRDYARCEGLGPNSVTLIITNPPMGKRVVMADLPRMMEDLFRVAAQALKPGGRLVLANPLRMENPHPLLQLQSRQAVDFGGFDCRMEKYVKLAR
jgi:precorrin-6B methylase 2